MVFRNSRPHAKPSRSRPLQSLSHLYFTGFKHALACVVHRRVITAKSDLLKCQEQKAPREKSRASEEKHRGNLPVKEVDAALRLRPSLPGLFGKWTSVVVQEGGRRDGSRWDEGGKEGALQRHQNF